MPTITLKNFPESLYDRIMHSVEVNRRNLNSEFIACIEQAVSHLHNPGETVQ